MNRAASQAGVSDAMLETVDRSYGLCRVTTGSTVLLLTVGGIKFDLVPEEGSISCSP